MPGAAPPRPRLCGKETMMDSNRWTPLRGVLKKLRGGAIAVSGGVDSMTLSAFAHQILGADDICMVHAISPAVPTAATARVRDHAARLGWSLSEVDAGEFDDPRYIANPVNRCFYCKSNLYRTLRSICDGVIISGTNTDDLSDYRPGLQAAAHNDDGKSAEMVKSLLGAGAAVECAQSGRIACNWH